MAKKNLTDLAYEAILNGIIMGRYLPGVMLTEEMLVEELSISRTPIRSALMRLQTEQLVTIFPKKGVQVRRITHRQISDIFNIRETLEPYCIRRFGSRFDKDRLERLYGIFSAEYPDCGPEPSPEKDVVYRADVELHTAVIDLTDNELLRVHYRMLTNLMQQIIVLAARVSGRFEISRTEHLDVIVPLLRDDYGLAADRMREHLVMGRRSAYDALEVLEAPPKT